MLLRYLMKDLHIKKSIYDTIITKIIRSNALYDRCIIDLPYLMKGDTFFYLSTLKLE